MGTRLLLLKLVFETGDFIGSSIKIRAQLPDTILEEDHPMTIPSKFGFN
jgi:hypothetical protein